MVRWRGIISSKCLDSVHNEVWRLDLISICLSSLRCFEDGVLKSARPPIIARWRQHATPPPLTRLCGELDLCNTKKDSNSHDPWKMSILHIVHTREAVNINRPIERIGGWRVRNDENHSIWRS